jgi:hypothetical protein
MALAPPPEGTKPAAYGCNRRLAQGETRAQTQGHSIEPGCRRGAQCVETHFLYQPVIYERSGTPPVIPVVSPPRRLGLKPPAATAANLPQAGYSPRTSVLQHTLAVPDTDFNRWRRGREDGRIALIFLTFINHRPVVLERAHAKTRRRRARPNLLGYLAPLRAIRDTQILGER